MFMINCSQRGSITETSEEVFPRYYMQCDVLSMSKCSLFYHTQLHIILSYISYSVTYHTQLHVNLINPHNISDRSGCIRRFREPIRKTPQACTLFLCRRILHFKIKTIEDNICSQVKYILKTNKQYK